MTKAALICFLGIIATGFVVLAATTKPDKKPTPVGYYDISQVVTKSKTAAAEIGSAIAGVSQAAARRAVDDYSAANKGPIATEVLAEKRRVADEAIAAYNKAVTDARAGAVSKLNDRLMPALNKLAADRKMTVVFPLGSALPYAVPDADLTEALVAALDGAGK